MQRNDHRGKKTPRSVTNQVPMASSPEPNPGLEQVGPEHLIQANQTAITNILAKLDQLLANFKDNELEFNSLYQDELLASKHTVSDKTELKLFHDVYQAVYQVVFTQKLTVFQTISEVMLKKDLQKVRALARQVLPDLMANSSKELEQIEEQINYLSNQSRIPST